MQKRDTLESLNTRYETREMVPNAFQSRTVLLQPTECTGRPSDFASQNVNS